MFPGERLTSSLNGRKPERDEPSLDCWNQFCSNYTSPKSTCSAIAPGSTCSCLDAR